MLEESKIPYFAWDRKKTVEDINADIGIDSYSRNRTIAWIMREAKFDDVWQFISPKDLWQSFDEILPYLGRKKLFWQYMLRTWNELGKI